MENFERTNEPGDFVFGEVDSPEFALAQGLADFEHAEVEVPWRGGGVGGGNGELYRGEGRGGSWGAVRERDMGDWLCRARGMGKAVWRGGREHFGPFCFLGGGGRG